MKSLFSFLRAASAQTPSKNDLERYFENHTGDLIHKWKHYFEIYDRHFSRFRDKEVVVVEIGVSQGGSMQMWRDYFGRKAQIHGVDIDPRCTLFNSDRIKIHIGDQSDRNFLGSLAREIPHIDILIDDGGHVADQQIATFEVLFPKIDSHGVYLCEDLHSAYWEENYGGGYKKPGTFIEYSKDFIDGVNAFHSREPEKFKVTEFTRTAHSVHFYDSVVVIEKRPISEPSHDMRGIRRLP